MRIKLSEIAKLVDGTLVGDDVDITGVASIKSAKEGDLTFLFSKKYLHLAPNSKATAFVVSEGITLDRNLIIVKNPPLAQSIILNYFFPIENISSYISQKAIISEKSDISDDVVIMDFAYISEGVKIGKNCRIYPFVYLGKNVEIGENVTIFPHVVIMDDVKIKDNAIIYPGAVLGSDGFGYAFNGKEYVKIPQIGNVIIEENVEIGANTTIDRATLDETRIGKGTKIDNLVMIGHNVEIGDNCIIVGQVGIAGSAKIGNRVIFGGQVGIADHAEIGDDVMIAAQSGVSGKVEKGAKLAGTFAIDFKKWLKIQAILNELPELKKKIDKIIKGREDGD